MKTGLIVYVVGNQFNEDEFDEEKAIQGLNIAADRVSFVFSGNQHDDIGYSWWAMTRKGMSRILCMAGEMIAPSTVRLTGREMQLSGY